MRYARKTYHYRAPANCEGVLFDASCVPCLDDPATKGWLLHMLREATGTQDACAMSDGETWNAGDEDPKRTTFDADLDDPPKWIGYPTEGEALAAALLAAWGHVA